MAKPMHRPVETIGVLVSDRFAEENTFYSSLCGSLQLSAGRKNVTCILETVSDQEEQDCTVPAMVSDGKVDGMIFLGSLSADYIRVQASRGLPCLLLDARMPQCGLDSVTSDNLDGGYALTKHLLTQGRTEIGFLGSIRSAASIMDRYLGHQSAMFLAGITPRVDWLLDDRDEYGRFIPIQLPSQLPQAFLCSCDEAACSLVNQLRQKGLRVPEDVAVCGYNDSHFALRCLPSLTTYRVSVEKMAYTAVERLLQRINSLDLERVDFTIPGRIVVRDSTRV